MAVIHSGDIVRAVLEGERTAALLIENLAIYHFPGDNLYGLICLYAQQFTPEADAFLRGLLRRIQQELERRAR